MLRWHVLLPESMQWVHAAGLLNPAARHRRRFDK
jgi:hypothetical protein